MVEQEAVNFEVTGSSPVVGAKLSTQRVRPSPMTGLSLIFGFNSDNLTTVIQFESSRLYLPKSAGTAKNH